MPRAEAAAESANPEETGPKPAAAGGRRGVWPSVSALWPWVASILSGLLLAFCFPRFGQGWLVWTALTPLVCAVWFAKKPRPFLYGYVMGLVFVPLNYHWLAELAPLFHTPGLKGLPIYLALYMALYPATWAWLLARLPLGERPFRSSTRNLCAGALGACIWTALEWTRGWLFSGFGWNGLGVALHEDLAMIQIADVVGVLGLTWLVAFVNLMAVIIVRRLIAELGPEFLKRVRWEFSGTMALIAVVFAYGVRALFQSPAPGTTLKIVALQPNTPQQEKFDPASEERVLADISKLHGLAALLSPAPDLIVWPEAAIPHGMFADEASYRFVMELAGRGDFEMLIGSMDYELDGKNEGQTREYNAAMLLSDHGRERSVYRKMHLVPYGEYLPLRSVLPQFIGNLVPGDLDAGSETLVLTMKRYPIRVGALVCFEDTLGDLTRGFVQKGAQLLVNITNDGWFGHSAAAEQHLANAVFRAIENRRPLVRGTNTGVTCAIDPAGRIRRGGLQPFEQGFTPFEVNVPTEPPLTFYSRFGDWVAHLSAAITLAFGAGLFAQRLRRKRPANP